MTDKLEQIQEALRRIERQSAKLGEEFTINTITKQALKLLDEHRQEMEWQDISTAPKDTFILLGNPEWITAWYGCWGIRKSGKQGWQRFNSEGQDFINPTHWKPLPQPPKGE